MAKLKRGTLLASAARTASTQSADQDVQTRNPVGVRLFLDVTANPGAAETLTVQIEMKDPVSNKYRAVTAFPAIAAATNATYIYELYPSVIETTATANHEVQGGTIPRVWRANVTHSAGGSWTYSIGYSELP